MGHRSLRLAAPAFPDMLQSVLLRLSMLWLHAQHAFGYDSLNKS